MRTDHKIGVAVVLFVVGVIVAYSVFSTDAPPPNSPAPGVASTGSERTPGQLKRESFYPASDSRVEEVITGLGKSIIGRAAEEAPAARGSRGALTSSNRTEPLGVKIGWAGTTSGAPGSISQSDNVLVYNSTPSARPSADQAPVARKDAAIEGWPAGGQPYVVKKGDRGFWTVAENAYGHGKYWPLVAKANPTADSNTLMPGQKLIIPPLPKARPSRAIADAPAGGNLKPGEKWYVVQKGDNGFWDVSKKNYDTGKHWELIAKANPRVNPLKMRVGQKLLIPPAPSAAAVAKNSPKPTPRRRISDNTVPFFD